MPVLRPERLSLAPGDLMKAAKCDKFPSRYEEACKEVLALAESSWDPKALYEFCRISFREEGVVWVENGTTGKKGPLKVGPRADLLAPASEVLLCVQTLGEAFCRQERVLLEKDLLKAYLFDCAGVLALSRLGAEVRFLAEREAAHRGWGVSPALLPGSLEGWSVEGQKEICDLLPTEAIGVRINDSFLLVPQKSESLVIGLGPEYASRTVGSLCPSCPRYAACSWRT